MSSVLIVEDDPNTLAGLNEILTEEGYHVYTALNSQQAISCISSSSIDIVLCDYRLPDMNGLKMCSELKTLQPTLVLFFFTAYYDKHVFNTAKAVGIAEIFIKPIVVDDLLNKLLVYAK